VELTKLLQIRTSQIEDVSFLKNKRSKATIITRKGKRPLAVYLDIGFFYSTISISEDYRLITMYRGKRAIAELWYEMLRSDLNQAISGDSRRKKVTIPAPPRLVGITQKSAPSAVLTGALGALCLLVLITMLLLYNAAPGPNVVDTISQAEERVQSITPEKPAQDQRSVQKTDFVKPTQKFAKPELVNDVASSAAETSEPEDDLPLLKKFSSAKETGKPSSKAVNEAFRNIREADRNVVGISGVPDPNSYAGIQPNVTIETPGGGNLKDLSDFRDFGFDLGDIN